MRLKKHKGTDLRKLMLKKEKFLLIFSCSELETIKMHETFSELLTP